MWLYDHLREKFHDGGGPGYHARQDDNSGTMIGENRQLATNEPVEFQK